MSDFTYEEKNSARRLENYEWTRVWLDSANDKEKPRGLYIGDSISAGILRIATKVSEGELLFDGIATSKALDHPMFLDYVRLFAKEEGRRSFILFNNGLHGWHLDDELDYPLLYENMVKALLSEFEGTPLLLVSSTATENEDRHSRVKKRNSAVFAIAKKYSLPIIDLYKISEEKLNLRSSDGVHYTEAGYTAMAEEIVKKIKELL